MPQVLYVSKPVSTVVIGSPGAGAGPGSGGIRTSAQERPRDFGARSSSERSYPSSSRRGAGRRDRKAPPVPRLHSRWRWLLVLSKAGIPFRLGRGIPHAEIVEPGLRGDAYNALRSSVHREPALWHLYRPRGARE